MTTKKKAATKAATKAKPKAKPLGSCARVRQIADTMPNAAPATVYAKCESAGIHPRTTRAEYANWCKDKFGKTPSERSKNGRAAKKKTTGKKKRDPLLTVI